MITKVYIKHLGFVFDFELASDESSEEVPSPDQIVKEAFEADSGVEDLDTEDGDVDGNPVMGKPEFPGHHPNGDYYPMESKEKSQDEQNTEEDLIIKNDLEEEDNDSIAGIINEEHILDNTIIDESGIDDINDEDSESEVGEDIKMNDYTNLENEENALLFLLKEAEQAESESKELLEAGLEEEDGTGSEESSIYTELKSEELNKVTLTRSKSPLTDYFHKYRVFIKYCVFANNSRKFAISFSSALGCYLLYKKQPIGEAVHPHCVESFEGLLQRYWRGRGCSEL